MLEQEAKQVFRCPECGQYRGELLYTQSAMKTLQGIHGNYGSRGVISFYKCQNCSHKWDSFSASSGPLWTFPVED